MVELEYLQGLSLPLLSLFFFKPTGYPILNYVVVFQTNRINYNFSGGGWVTGQPKPFFETFASALLAWIAGKITYKFATVSHNLKKLGNC